MVKGFAVLVGTLLSLDLAVGAIGFALKYNRFPGLAELLDWVF